MILEGTITISRDSRDSIRIAVEDKRSSTRFVEAQMTPHDFAVAVTGMGYVGCRLDVGGLHHVGKVREHKTEIVPRPKEDHYAPLAEHERIAREVLAPFEVDGWKGRWGDLFNPHNSAGIYDAPAYRVVFERWVEAPEDGEGA